MKYRRLFPLAIGMCLALLAGCTSGGEPTTSSPPVSSTTSSPTDSATDSGAWEEVIAAAKAEGALNLYSISEEAGLLALAEAFEEKYGIPVEVTRLTDGNLRQRFSAEYEAGQANADIVEVTGLLFPENEPTWFADLRTDAPYIADYPEANWTEKAAVAWISAYGFAWNTDLMTDPPTTWEEALEVATGDDVAIIDATVSAGYMGWAANMRDQFGIEYLQALGELGPQHVQSGVNGSQLLAAGSAQILLPVNFGLVAPLMEEGAPIEWTTPENSPVTAGGTQIPSNAPHPNAAQLWVDFRLSIEGSKVMCSVTKDLPAYPSDVVSDCAGRSATEGWVVADFSVFDDATQSAEIAQALGIG